VQESLTNVHRHAANAAASVRLKRYPDGVVLEIADKAHGFRSDVILDETGAPKPMGVGLRGMRELIRQLGGIFDVAFSKTGTTVRVKVPQEGT
jgi:signal transduction histidine kinase